MEVMLTRRQQGIIQLLKINNVISVDEIADYFKVTPTTIRRDLTVLEQNNIVQRSHGYVQLVDNYYVSSFNIRKNMFSQEKLLIAQKALTYLNGVSTVIIDSGTSTFALANEIATNYNKKLAILTNSLPVASTLAGKFMVMMTGGMVEESTLSLVGPEADLYIESVVADKVFLGATGINVDLGLTVSSPLHYSIKTKMLQSGKENIVLIDSSKFSTGGLTVFCSLDKIGTIITAKTNENAAQIEKLIDRGINVDYIDMTE